MGDRLGLIAGSGDLPGILFESARTKGYECVVAGLREEAGPELESRAAGLQPIFA